MDAVELACEPEDADETVEGMPEDAPTLSAFRLARKLLQLQKSDAGVHLLDCITTIFHILSHQENEAAAEEIDGAPRALLPPLAAVCAKAAEAAYASRRKQLLSALAPLFSEKEVVYSQGHESSATDAPAHAIIVSKRYKCIFVTIKGTSGVVDFLVDAVAHSVNGVHEGMAGVAASFGTKAYGDVVLATLRKHRHLPTPAAPSMPRTPAATAVPPPPPASVPPSPSAASGAAPSGSPAAPTPLSVSALKPSPVADSATAASPADTPHYREGLTAVLWELLRANPGYNVVLTGHSLGAGIAAILTLKLRARLFRRFLAEGQRLPWETSAASATASGSASPVPPSPALQTMSSSASSVGFGLPARAGAAPLTHAAASPPAKAASEAVLPKLASVSTAASPTAAAPPSTPAPAVLSPAATVVNPTPSAGQARGRRSISPSASAAGSDRSRSASPAMAASSSSFYAAPSHRNGGLATARKSPAFAACLCPITVVGVGIATPACLSPESAALASLTSDEAATLVADVMPQLAAASAAAVARIAALQAQWHVEHYERVGSDGAAVSPVGGTAAASTVAGSATSSPAATSMYRTNPSAGAGAMPAGPPSWGPHADETRSVSAASLSAGASCGGRTADERDSASLARLGLISDSSESPRAEGAVISVLHRYAGTVHPLATHELPESMRRWPLLSSLVMRDDAVPRLTLAAAKALDTELMKPAVVRRASTELLAHILPTAVTASVAGAASSIGSAASAVQLAAASVASVLSSVLSRARTGPSMTAADAKILESEMIAAVCAQLPLPPPAASADAAPVGAASAALASLAVSAPPSVVNTAVSLPTDSSVPPLPQETTGAAHAVAAATASTGDSESAGIDAAVAAAAAAAAPVMLRRLLSGKLNSPSGIASPRPSSASPGLLADGEASEASETAATVSALLSMPVDAPTADVITSTTAILVARSASARIASRASPRLRSGHVAAGASVVSPSESKPQAQAQADAAKAELSLWAWMLALQAGFGATRTAAPASSTPQPATDAALNGGAPAVSAPAAGEGKGKGISGEPASAAPKPSPAEAAVMRRLGLLLATCPVNATEANQPLVCPGLIFHISCPSDSAPEHGVIATAKTVGLAAAHGIGRAAVAAADALDAAIGVGVDSVGEEDSEAAGAASTALTPVDTEQLAAAADAAGDLADGVGAASTWPVLKQPTPAAAALAGAAPAVPSTAVHTSDAAQAGEDVTVPADECCVHIIPPRRLAAIRITRTFMSDHSIVQYAKTAEALSLRTGVLHAAELASLAAAHQAEQADRAIIPAIGAAVRNKRNISPVAAVGVAAAGVGAVFAAPVIATMAVAALAAVGTATAVGAVAAVGTAAAAAHYRRGRSSSPANRAAEAAGAPRAASAPAPAPAPAPAHAAASEVASQSSQPETVLPSPSGALAALPAVSVPESGTAATVMAAAVSVVSGTDRGSADKAGDKAVAAAAATATGSLSAPAASPAAAAASGSPTAGDSTTTITTTTTANATSAAAARRAAARAMTPTLACPSVRPSAPSAAVSARQGVPTAAGTSRSTTSAFDGDEGLPPASGDAALPPASGDAALPPASGDAVAAATTTTATDAVSKILTDVVAEADSGTSSDTNPVAAAATAVEQPSPLPSAASPPQPEAGSAPSPTAGSSPAASGFGIRRMLQGVAGWFSGWRGTSSTAAPAAAPAEVAAPAASATAATATETSAAAPATSVVSSGEVTVTVPSSQASPTVGVLAASDSDSSDAAHAASNGGPSGDVEQVGPARLGCGNDSEQ